MSASVVQSSVPAIGGQSLFVLNARRGRYASRNSRRSGAAKVTALFGRKKAEPAPPPPSPPKPSLFGGMFGGKKDQGEAPAQQVRDVEYVPQETMTDAYARVRAQRAKSKAKFEAQEKGGLSLFMFNALSAVNFEVRV